MPYRSTLLPLIGIVAGMVMLAYASVPLYRLFCQVTGFGGTTQRAAMYQGKASERTITVRFNADTDPQLPWKFTPMEKSITVHIGENRLTAFRAVNLSDRPTRGHATYNVTPHAAGVYFNKVQCFCFNEQWLSPKQDASLPVSFFIDPAILEDRELRDLTNITLSYTFFSYDSANK